MLIREGKSKVCQVWVTEEAIETIIGEKWCKEEDIFYTSVKHSMILYNILTYASLKIFLIIDI